MTRFGMKMERDNAIANLSEIINGIQLTHPVRIGLDGVDASGKTQLADEIAEVLKCLGRDIIRVSIDRFHNPRKIRYRQGRLSADGYYEDSFNFKAIISKVLEPLGPGGKLIFYPESFDFISDSVVRSSACQAKDNSILLFDGVFLHHPQIVDYWDFTVFVDCSFDVAIKRAIARDLHLLETADQINEMYKLKYIPGQKIYLESESPMDRANIVFHNSDLDFPEMEIRHDW